MNPLLALVGIAGLSASALFTSGLGASARAALGVGAASSVTASAAASSAVAAQPAGTIAQVAEQAGQFTTLLKAAQAAGLAEALGAPGTYTVFAPTDEAFARLGARGEALLRPENRERLRQVLSYHVLPQQLSAANVLANDDLKTLNGQRLATSFKDGRVRVNESNIVATDVAASNGTIHVIDRVLVPARENIVQVASGNHSFRTLVAAVQAAGLVEALSGPGPFTVFAPTDEAFAKLPAGTLEALLKPENRETLVAILKYHVVPARVYADEAAIAGVATTLQGEKVTPAFNDGRLKVDGSTIVTTDLDASNGVIHVIDSVLLPEEARSALSAAPARAASRTGDAMRAPTASAGVQRALARAIERGVPLFNMGDARACAEVYTTAIEGVLERPETELGDADRRVLRDALTAAGAERDAAARAWLLREAMDRVLGQPTERMAPARPQQGA